MNRCLLLSWILILLVACAPEQQQEAPAVSDYQPTVEEQALLDQLADRQSKRELDEGIAAAEEFLASHPKARRIHYAIGILHGMADHHQLALAAFERELEGDAGHIASYRGAANALVRLGREPEAIERLVVALEIDPDNTEVRLELGRTLSNLGRFEQADEVLARAVDRGSVPARVELGILQRRQGRLQEASDTFRAALRQDPDELGAMVNLGQTLISLGRIDEGQALLRRHAARATLQDRLDVYRRSSLLDGATANNYLHLANLQLRAKRSALAVDSYRRALELDSESTTATLGLAALFHQDGQAREATKWTVHTLLLEPENSKAHFMLGVLRLSKGQVDEALAAFAASRSHPPGWDAEAYWRVGDMLRARSRLDLAEQHYQQALEADDQANRGWYGLALTQALQGEMAKALDSAQRATSLDAAGADSLLLLGLLQQASGDTEAAQQTLERAAALHRLEILTGQNVDRLLAPAAELPGVEPALVAYRQMLEAQ